MRTRTWAILTPAALSLATAVAVAWAFAALPKRLGPRRGELDGWTVPRELAWPRPVPEGWPTAMEWSSTGMTPENRGRARAFPHSTTVLGRDFFHMEAWGTGAGRPDDEPAPIYYAERETFGWPWRAAQVLTMETGVDNVRTDALRSLYHRGLELRPRTGPYDRPPVLPLRPVWPGLAADAAVYTAAWWSLLKLPGARRRWRERHGRCGACGYPAGPSAVCSECGAPRPPASL